MSAPALDLRNVAQAKDTPSPVLELRRVTKYFQVGGWPRSKRLRALSDVSFTLGRSEVLALVGESGSGKSTVARLVARLMPPSEGEILFRGKDVWKSEPHRASREYRSQVQMIFQDPFGSLNPVRTIGEHLERPLRIHDKARGQDDLRKRIYALLDTVGLNPPVEVAAKYPHQLSGGQRQRVAIARAVAVDPILILADEPISMLDVSIRMGVLNLMDRLKTERGISYLYITHDIVSARYIGDRTMVMYAGNVVEGAKSDELMRHPAHPYTQLLLSAVPDPEGRRTTLSRTNAAPSESTHAQSSAAMPSLIAPPPGCPFASRCPGVMDVCRVEMPGVDHLDGDHWVRCHLYSAGKRPQPPDSRSVPPQPRSTEERP